MKRGIFFSFMLTLVSAIFAQTNASNSLDIQRILDRKKLIVVITATDQPPFYFVDKSGKLTGYDIDLAQSIANELGVGLEITREAASFNDLVTLVGAGKADLAVSKLSRTLARAQKVKFSTPYMTFKQGLLFNRLQLSKVTSESEVQKYVRDYTGTIGVIAASSYANYAKENFPKAQIIEYKTWDDAIDALKNNEVLSVYRDELEIKRVLANTPNSGLLFKAVYFSDLTDPIAIAVNKDDFQLLFWLNIFLENHPKATAESILELYSEK